MQCLDDNDLILFAHGDIKDPQKAKDIFEHIQICQKCKEQYLFLLQLPRKEEIVFGFLEQQKIPVPKVDVMIYPQAKGFQRQFFVNLSKVLTIVQGRLQMRAVSSRSLKSINIKKKDGPMIYLMEDEEKSGEQWFLYSDQDIRSLSIIEMLPERKIRYQAPYQKSMLLPISCSAYAYEIQVGRKPLFSFKFIKET